MSRVERCSVLRFKLKFAVNVVGNIPTVGILQRVIIGRIETVQIVDIVLRNGICIHRAVGELRQEGIDVNFIVELGNIHFFISGGHRIHNRRIVERHFVDLNGISGQHIFFRIGYVVVKSARQSQYERYANDADAARDGSDDGAAALGIQIACAQTERRL